MTAQQTAPTSAAVTPKKPRSRRASKDLTPLTTEPAEKVVTPEEAAAQAELVAAEKAARRAARDQEVATQTARLEFESKVNEKVTAGRSLEQEIRDANEVGEAPFKAVRVRRKSKDLEKEAMQLLSDELEKVFLSCPRDADGLLPTTELKDALDKAPGDLKTSHEALSPIIKEINFKKTGRFDVKGTGIDFEEFKSIAWSTAVGSARSVM